MSLYFTSDQHFGHVNILKYAERPFECTREGMTDCARYMYDNYQKTVKTGDTVVFLGDVALINDENRLYYMDMLSSMKGRKMLILGNHDNQSKGFYYGCGFLDVRDFYIVDKFFICHYPCTASGSPAEKKAKSVFFNTKCAEIYHGHIHNKHPASFDGISRYNMCVDYKPNDFRPVLIQNYELNEFFEDLR